ncbi:MAG: sporulation integral membrane protein YtvI [Oscillospiraceae bacterium]|nr:sporulation integral membrane protein YtvI [Oscillospiraceae bacterium]
MEQKRRFLVTLAYWSAILALVYLGLRYALAWLLPFLPALAVAAWVEPAVQWVRHKMHLKRPFLAAVITLAVTAMTVAAAVAILSALWRQLTDLLGQAPQLLSALPSLLTEITARLEEFRVRLPQESRQAMNEALTALGNALGSAAVNLSTSLLESVKGWMGKLPGLLLFCATAVMALFFTVSSYPQLRRFFIRQIPREKLAAARELKEGALGAVWRWARAQVLLITVTFAELLAGFLLLRRDYALLFAFLIALLDALPIFGAGMVLLPWAAILALTGDTVGALGLAALYVIVWLVRSFLEPKILGKSGGLPPLPSLFAIYVGFRIAGVAGMILGPLVLLLMKEFHDRRLVRLWK